MTRAKLLGISLTAIILVGVVLAIMILKKTAAYDFFYPHLIEANGPVQDLPFLLKDVTTIACIGDSITYSNGDHSGFPTRLEACLSVIFPQQKIRVLNKGISGEHSHEMLKRFQRDAIDTGSQLIIIFAGVNDVGHGFSNDYPNGDGPRGTSLAKYLESMAAMIKLAKDNSRKVLLITPPTIFEDSDNVMDKKLETYCLALGTLAADQDIPVADVRRAFVELTHAYQSTCNSSDYLLTTDGVHPNSLGNKVITESVMAALGITASSRKHVLEH